VGLLHILFFNAPLLVLGLYTITPVPILVNFFFFFFVDARIHGMHLLCSLVAKICHVTKMCDMSRDAWLTDMTHDSSHGAHDITLDIKKKEKEKGKENESWHDSLSLTRHMTHILPYNKSCHTSCPTFPFSFFLFSFSLLLQCLLL